ncbi:hypothetical protein [Halopiger thermotolerans]
MKTPATTFVVSFDGSELTEAALVGAVAYGRILEEAVAAVTVVPERKRYARDKGRIDEDEAYDIFVVRRAAPPRLEEIEPYDDFYRSDDAADDQSISIGGKTVPD